MTESQQQVMNGLHLFKALIKDGCLWQGDIVSNNWSECLYVPVDQNIQEHVAYTLAAYTENKDFKRVGSHAIYIV